MPTVPKDCRYPRCECTYPHCKPKTRKELDAESKQEMQYIDQCTQDYHEWRNRD